MEQVQAERRDGGQDDIYTGTGDLVSVLNSPITMILIVPSKSNALITFKKVKIGSCVCFYAFSFVCVCVCTFILSSCLCA